MTSDNIPSNRQSLSAILRGLCASGSISLSAPVVHEAATILDDVDLLLGRLAECFDDDESEFTDIADIRKRLEGDRGAVETAAPHPDTMRLDWLQAKPDEFANIDRITSVTGKFNGHSTLREAIDHARETPNS